MSIVSHYIKNGLRGLRRQKVVAFINIVGLATGISGFILILLFLQNELNYEKHIPESDDIYRLVEIQKPAGIDVQHVAITSGPWGPALKESLPEVVDVLRLTNARRNLFSVDTKTFTEGNCYYAESSVLRFFNIHLIEGSPEGVLDKPNTAIISQRVAEKFFGRQSVTGETFRLQDTPFIITGVMENYDYNSHLHFEIILSYPTFEKQTPALSNWGANFLSTYILLKPGHSKELTEYNIANLIDTQMNETGFENAPRPEMYLQPMTDIHLKSKHIKFSIFDTRGDIILVYVFAMVAFLILFIGCINYINLATAQATKRSTEVGIRKTLGAKPSTLFFQFITESFLTIFISLVISLGLVELFLPEFNAILNTDLKIDFMGNPIFNAGLAGILIVTSLLAGTYPAFFMSRFKTVNVLRKQTFRGRIAGWSIRKVLVIFQFSISVMLVFGTMIFYHQWIFLKDHDLGIDYENVVSIPLRQEEPDPEVLQQLKAAFLNEPAIEGAAVASGPNGVSGSQSLIVVADSPETQLMVRFGYVDQDYFPVMGIEIVEGRNFSYNFGTDSTEAIIINESAVKALGWDNPVGKQFADYWDSSKRLTVIGVIEDYNFYSLHGEIEPATFRMTLSRSGNIMARIDPDKRKQAIRHMKMQWEQFFPGIPFEPSFVNENIQQQYRAEANATRVITFFAVLALIISAMGLYGLTAFLAEQKRKEIGIRKVLGESTFSIIFLMQKIFMQQVIVALAIGLPLVYLYIDNWLGNFAYRITLQWWHFIVSAGIIILLALFTVLSQAYKAARANPVDSIKYE